LPLGWGGWCPKGWQFLTLLWSQPEHRPMGWGSLPAWEEALPLSPKSHLAAPQAASQLLGWL